jgi:hypothetical protein
VTTVVQMGPIPKQSSPGKWSLKSKAVRLHKIRSRHLRYWGDALGNYLYRANAHGARVLAIRKNLIKEPVDRIGVNGNALMIPQPCNKSWDVCGYWLAHANG